MLHRFRLPQDESVQQWRERGVRGSRRGHMLDIRAVPKPKRVALEISNRFPIERTIYQSVHIATQQPNFKPHTAPDRSRRGHSC